MPPEYRSPQRLSEDEPSDHQTVQAGCLLQAKAAMRGASVLKIA